MSDSLVFQCQLLEIFRKRKSDSYFGQFTPLAIVVYGIWGCQGGFVKWGIIGKILERNQDGRNRRRGRRDETTAGNANPN